MDLSSAPDQEWVEIEKRASQPSPDEPHSIFREPERGQGLVEYGLVLILVAIVIVAILVLLGPQISNLYSRVTSDIGRY